MGAFRKIFQNDAGDDSDGESVARAVTWAEAKMHLRLTGETERAYVELLIDAAMEYAEDAMFCALMPQTIVATFDKMDRLDLPRTPVIAIQSVIDAANANLTGAAAISYPAGYVARISIAGTPVYPVSVTYEAGFAVMPAKFKAPILAHVGTLYAHRESVSEKGPTPVPHSLDAFYQLNRRSPGVG